jgi:hypothetical protein
VTDKFDPCFKRFISTTRIGLAGDVRLNILIRLILKLNLMKVI